MASFDFSLSLEEQFSALEQQLDQKLCDGIYPINTTFNWEGQQIKTALLYHQCCKDSHQVECRSVPSIDLLINADGQLLLEGEPTHLDRLQDSIEIEIGNYLNDLYPEYTAFRILWDSESDLEIRQTVFKNCLGAHQNFMAQKAEKRFGKSLAKLDGTELEELKKNHQFALYLHQAPAIEVPIPDWDPEVEIDSTAINH